MAQITAFSDRDITTRERLEDYAADDIVTTAGGLSLQVAMVCDGAGGGEAGELAARLTSRTIVEFLQISTEANIPKLLVKAVEKANQVVYSELRGAGTSTLALIAVDLGDGTPFGRMYVASVGNSRIYIVRDGNMVRLNIDHTLANEYVYAGQMSFEEASHLENADYVTRAIGINTEIQVDIGFYAERGKAFVNSRRAFRIGQKGMVLKEGDTIFAASDGMFEFSPTDNKPYVQEEEFLRHALEDDVERAGRALMRHAAARHPDDNTSISLLFVPSRTRKPVSAISDLSSRQKLRLAAASVILLLLIAALGANAFQSNAQTAALQATHTVIAELALQLSYTPTASPSPTATATATPTPTPTLRPTLAAQDQVGVQYFLTRPNGPVLTGKLNLSQEINFLLLVGEQTANTTQNIQPANLYLQEDTVVEISRIDNVPDRESLDSVLYPQGDMYANTGDFRRGGVEVALQQNASIKFNAETQCIAARQIPPDVTKPDDPDKVALTCFTGNNGDCAYRFPDTQEPEGVVMPIGKRVLLDVTNQKEIEVGPILFDEVKTYYDTVYSLTKSDEQVKCLAPFLDEDADGVSYPADTCPSEAGSAETGGCPDSDGDTLADSLDQCPNTAGDPANNGCPLPTATPLPDVDGDGLNDVVDRCPFASGLVSTRGCPPASATPRVYANAIDDLFVMREQERDESGRENTASLAVAMIFGFAGLVGTATLHKRRKK
jgi:serine/threonine protein phosphatase PrpC